MFVSDGLKSLEKAISKVYPTSVHQKCIVHLIRTILAKVGSNHKEEIAAYFRLVLDPDNKEYNKKEVLKRLKYFADKWGKIYRHIKILAQKDDISDYFNYLQYDSRIRRMIYTTIYTTNWIECFNKSCRRTLKIRNSFPSPDAALALIK